ncbi:MAG: hypothetical protein WBV82_30260 [Myxococcaceae bacterium]
MTRSFAPCVTAIASAFLLLSSAPAFACEGHGEKGERGEKAHACACQHGKQEDPLLTATCTCSGKSDCTCKKGACQCTKCGKHHGTKKSSFVEPLKGATLSPDLPDSARVDATAGIFI